jgi:hypothetical protein
MTTQSAFLRSLADHLDEHGVLGVSVSWYPWDGRDSDRPLRLQLTVNELAETDDDTIRQLAAWAASLGVRTARLRSVNGRIHVHVHGQIGEWHVDAWDSIDVRPELLDRRTIPVAELGAVVRS